jgi:UDP-4-amino-4,6-dideoxy-N-acetyl-beta-L-altrosamine transaminase
MIPYGRHCIEEDDIEAVVAQMRSGWLTQGPAVGEFEAAVAEYVGAKYAVAISNGTAGLHLACLAANVSTGDCAITSPNSFVASANGIHYAGGRAEFVDIERDSLNLDAAALRERCRRGPAPKAIVPVHFAGLPCNMRDIAATASSAGAMVIEDAAHALGSRYSTGEKVGSCAYSDMAVFSFHPVKSIACGEGGMVTTNSETLYRRLLRLRSHGINKLDDPFQNPQVISQTDGRVNRWYYEMQELGFNFRLTDMQAALGMSQLRKIDRFLARRRELANRYRSLLPGGDPRLRAAQSGGWGDSANHLFVIRVPFGVDAPSRNAYMQRLYDRGYVTQVHYIPIPLQPYYARLGHDMDRLPEARRYYAEALSIPLYVGLTDEQQAEFVRNAIACLA